MRRYLRPMLVASLLLAVLACSSARGADGVCLRNSLGVARLQVGAFTLAWTHSIEKVRWEELWQVTAAGLLLDTVRVRGVGAGMEPPPEAVLIHGHWVWHPRTLHGQVLLTRSGYTADYEWCDERGQGGRPLERILASDGDVTEMAGCR